MSAGSTRLPRVSLNGVLLVDKPSGMTSNQVIGQVKRLFRPKKIGHLGTLDPLATGMLPLVMGDATKFSSYGLFADKCYQVRLKLGVQTDSFDSNGAVVAMESVSEFSDAKINRVLQSFSGEIDQIPPVYSALKWKGKPLYAWMREGYAHTIDSSVLADKKRRVTIKELKLLSRGKDYIECRVYCSKGTYIRSLVNDIGLELGCFAHVTMLRREFVASFSGSIMYTLEQLSELGGRLNGPYILPMDCLLQHLPRLDVSNLDQQILMQGQPIFVSDIKPNQIYRLYSGQVGFFGLAEHRQGRCWPKRLCAHKITSGDSDST